MKAAVVTDFAQPPHYQDFEEPAGDVVEVLAAALSPRVRSQAAGTHYSSDERLPLIPGIDGVGRTASGELRYFLLPDTDRGAMADRVAIDLRRSIPLPKDSDPVRIAAAMNPVMSSWVALRRRAQLKRGQRVLVLGAGGNAGRLALQVARRLGAGEVAGIRREETRRPRCARGCRRASRHRARLPVGSADGRCPACDRACSRRRRAAAHVGADRLGRGSRIADPFRGSARRQPAARGVRTGVRGPERHQGRAATHRARDRQKGDFEVDARAVRLRDVESVWGERTKDRIVLVP